MEKLSLEYIKKRVAVMCENFYKIAGDIGAANVELGSRCPSEKETEQILAELFLREYINLGLIDEKTANDYRMELRKELKSLYA